MVAPRQFEPPVAQSGSDVPGPGPLELPAGIMIDENNPVLVDRLRECFAHQFAPSFKENLDRLAGFAGGGGKVCLGLDFAPLSFGFAVLRPNGSCWIVGGLIYHGSHDRGGDGGAPTYSVSLEATEGWSIHT